MAIGLKNPSVANTTSIPAMERSNENMDSNYAANLSQTRLLHCSYEITEAAGPLWSQTLTKWDYLDS